MNRIAVRAYSCAVSVFVLLFVPVFGSNAQAAAGLPWCAPEKAPAPIVLEGRSYADAWETALPAGQDSLGAIYMKSGLVVQGRLQGHKIRDFAWAYQLQGQKTWHKIPQASEVANRFQLIFRFAPIRHVARVRLLVGPRSAEELELTGANNPCLRDAQFFAKRDVLIPTEPWWMSVATWEEGNRFDPMRHWGERFDPWPAVRQAVHELGLESSPDSSDSSDLPDLPDLPDLIDEMWIGDFGPWVLQEPAPAGFLLSGNYKDYDSVDGKVYDGFYRFMREHELGPRAVPMLGACGGHQLIAMAGVHATEASFMTEFAPYKDSLGQVVVTCSTVPAYACGSLDGASCCYEGGEVQPFKDLVPNVPGLAMSNPYQSERWDMLFNLLPPEGERAMKSYLYHEDFVNPAQVARDFDVIATYPATVAGLSRENPSLVQAIKLKRGPVYGTQFHWDENHVGQCGRDPGTTNMERVLKNFVEISLSAFQDPNVVLSSVSQPEALEHLRDLDRASLWCGHEFTADFGRARALSAVLWVEGRDARQASKQSYRVAVSSDGLRWHDLEFARESLYELQKDRLDGCDPASERLAGGEDGQTFVLKFGHRIQARYLRIRLASADGEPACLREVMPY